jgi:hypothetical protein
VRLRLLSCAVERFISHLLSVALRLRAVGGLGEEDAHLMVHLALAQFALSTAGCTDDTCQAEVMFDRYGGDAGDEQDAAPVPLPEAAWIHVWRKPAKA